MKIETKILSYTVLKDCISVQLVCSDKDSAAPEKFVPSKDNTEYFTIGNIGTKGAIKSVNIRKGVHLLLHLPRTTFIAKTLFTLMDRETVPVSISSEQENGLLTLLDRASKCTGKTRQELIRELTAFQGKNGPVEGKDSIYEMSPRHQEVLVNKLTRIVQSKKESKQE